MKTLNTFCLVKKENRTYRMYLEDMNLAMEGIAEYIHGYSFDYKIFWDVALNYLPENKQQLEIIIEREKKHWS